MESVSEWLRSQFGLSPAMQGRLVSSLFLIFFLWLMRRLVLLGVSRLAKDQAVVYRWRKVSLSVAVVIGLIGIAGVWSATLRGIATFLGIVSAGLAIALKDFLTNMAGWAFILWRKPFELGDRIQLGNLIGDIVDIRLFQFTVLEVGNWADADQTTGRLVHVPNARVINEGVANYTHGFQYIWDELSVLVTFESDWRAAKALLAEVAQEYGATASEVAAAQIARTRERFLISGVTFEPVVYTSVEDSGVLLTLRYVCHARRRRATAESIWEDVLTAFSERDDIDFAYPTTRFYTNPTEGKPGTRPPV